VFNALRRDNWLHRFMGNRHRQAEEIRRQIRAAFYPDTAEWKRLVWKAAKDVVRPALQALG